MDSPQIITFKTPAAWEEWLSKNYHLDEGVMIRIFKKATGHPTITHAEALDVALCYGWIDGVRKGYDDESFLQKFTPRRKRSLWSKVNIEHTERLIKAGNMREPGLQEIERAKADGRWDQAYDSQKNMVVPEDFISELKKDKKAYEFYQTLNKTNTFAIGFRLQTAKKPETRARRMGVILAMLKEGKKFY